MLFKLVKSNQYLTKEVTLTKKCFRIYSKTIYKVIMMKEQLKKLLHSNMFKMKVMNHYHYH